MDQQELHISSMVVHAKPEYLATVKNNIEQLPGAEIHGESDKGKLVVVVETQDQGYITDVIEKIINFEHVLSTALVYHQIEQLDSLGNDKL
jgi:nitrate reductase NapD